MLAAIRLQVGRCLSIVFLYIFIKLSGTLQVEPTHLLTAELNGTLLKDGVDSGVAAQSIVGAFDGTSLTKLVDGCHGSIAVAQSQLALCLDEIHLRDTHHDGITARDVVGWVILIILVIQELLDTWE